MIVIKIKCGLGNQLFQYALGSALKNNGAQVKYDLSWFGNYNEKDVPRDLAIDQLKIEMPLATPAEITALRPSKLQLFFEKARGKFILNYHYAYHAGILRKKKAYLDGYFQSYKYFTPIREKLLCDFQIVKGYSELAITLKSSIELETNSVAIHIRRGDYATIREDYNGLCGVDYYKKGIDLIREKVGNLKLFIFSDDIEWARENLDFGLPIEFVSRPGLSDVEELLLMSLCKHQVIANSTFSWWAAWLNQHAEKIIVAPQNWLAAAKIDTSDLIPADWLRV
jgi:hypothetical protein